MPCTVKRFGTARMLNAFGAMGRSYQVPPGCGAEITARPASESSLRRVCQRLQPVQQQ